MTMDDPVLYHQLMGPPDNASPPTPKPHIRRYYAGATFGWVWGLYPTRQSPSPTLWACSLPALTGYLSLASNARIAP